MTLSGRIAKISEAGMAIIAIPRPWRRIGDVIEVKAEPGWYVDQPVTVEIKVCSNAATL